MRNDVVGVPFLKRTHLTCLSMFIKWLSID